VAGMPAYSAGGTADTVWRTPSLPPKDYCAELKKQLGKG